MDILFLVTPLKKIKDEHEVLPNWMEMQVVRTLKEKQCILTPILASQQTPHCSKSPQHWDKIWLLNIKVKAKKPPEPIKQFKEDKNNTFQMNTTFSVNDKGVKRHISRWKN